MGDIHVMPVNDLREHDDSDACWCHPVRDDEESKAIVHNSMDQRETYELGRRLQ